MDGHNGKRFDRNVRMKTACKKTGKRKAARKNGARQRKARR
jgi:hypothetical protein